MKQTSPTAPLASRLLAFSAAALPVEPLVLCLLALCLQGLVRPAAAQQNISFNATDLSVEDLDHPTSLQFGPDERLYVSQQDGLIRALTVERQGEGSYEVTAAETIGLVQTIPNHGDDGALNTEVTDRQITGIHVTGTAAKPVLYVSSSDPRVGAGGGGSDLGLDTNSGIISKLNCPGGISNNQCQDGWKMVHLVRGLPRSEENHATNGLELDAEAGVLYVAQGGHTNGGAPSNNFAELTEYALSAAILEIDLEAIEAMPTKTGSEGQAYKYDLPTLDDPTRANTAAGSDPGDPFGGNDGLNQAKLVAGGPVQIYSPGWRNPYDLELVEGGGLYVVDNGPNGGWGGYPQYEESPMCTNAYLSGEPGSTGPGPDPAGYPDSVALLPGSNGAPDVQVNNQDNLHYVPEKGYYAGHPTPVRGNPTGAGLLANGTYRDASDSTGALPADWPAVPEVLARPVECDYRQPEKGDGALYTWGKSTNGLAEYTASNFDGALQGNLLAASFTDDGKIHRIEFNGAGDEVTEVSSFASSFGAKPLDVVAQGDDDPFGGTVWAATYGTSDVTVFEPADYDGSTPPVCTGDDDDTIDEDADGYSNADEIASGTNPCSAADKPADFDGTLASDGFKDSDQSDLDDDDDGLSDVEDPFALDAENGLATSLPVNYDLFNGEPGTGIGGVGFTGLMTEGSTGYQEFLDPGEDLIIGGTSGLFTNPSVGAGDAYQTGNDQVNALQFGVDVDQSTPPFTVEAQINGPFNGIDGNYASQGLYIGPGDQDNYLKVVLNDGSNGGGGFQVLLEESGSVGLDISQDVSGLLEASNVMLYLSVDPAASTVQAKYAADGGPVTYLGLPVSIPSSWLSSSDEQGLGVGFIATSTGPAPGFAATWDYVNVTQDPVTAKGTWTTVDDFSETRHENAFVQAGEKFYLLGGRESKTTQSYNPDTEAWAEGTAAPTMLHHFEAVTVDGMIVAGMAFDDNDYPHETPAKHLYFYDPVGDTWTTGPQIPESRRRGSAGAFAREGKIYFVGGIQDGHSAGHVPWFDKYDPTTGTWTQLPDAPRARDHFFATYNATSDKLYLIGGRTSDVDDGSMFNDVIPEVDVYDFETESWTMLPAEKNLPTPRAGAPTELLGGEIIVAGGESGTQVEAHAATEAFDLQDETWRTLAKMHTPRHSVQAVASGGSFYVAAGSPEQGGPSGAELPFEVFYFGEQTPPGGPPLTASILTAPEMLDFGTAGTEGDSLYKELKLKSAGGNQSIIVEDVTISGSSAFAVKKEPLPRLIESGSEVHLEVVYGPTGAEAETATLTVTYGAGKTLDVALEGSGGSLTAVARVNAGGGAFTDAQGHAWQADTESSFFTGGQTYSSDVTISATDDDALYQSERYGGAEGAAFDYQIPLSGGEGPYTVRLHFAEIYWGVENNAGPGARVFDVMVEGQTVLEGYDILADVGPATAVTKTYTGRSDANGNGTLDISFEASDDNAKLSGIEVLVGADASETQPVSEASAKGPNRPN